MQEEEDDGVVVWLLLSPENREKYKCLRFQNLCNAALLRTTSAAASAMVCGVRERRGREELLCKAVAKRDKAHKIPEGLCLLASAAHAQHRC